jgi:uncharacterized membrane protein
VTVVSDPSDQGPGEHRATAWVRPPGGRTRDPRRVVTSIASLVDVATLALVLGGIHGHPRQLAGLVFCLFVPGWAIIGLLRLGEPVLEFGLTMAAGLAALVVLAQFVITVHAWHLYGVEVVVCLVCLASLLAQLQLARVRRRR